MLDLSAAFDTVDHKILLSRLQYHLAINYIALDWCKSYLLNRPQHVCIGNAVAKPVILDYSVPQGSVLGPQWFTVYTSPIRDIILKYNLNYHDTQLYITFKSSQEPADSCIITLEKCIQEIRSWMRQNFLKLNDEKTEFLLFGSRQQLSKVCLPFITIGDSQITPSSQARNLGVIFDSTMTLKPHTCISNIVCVSSFHIRNISRIRKYLKQSAAEQIMHLSHHGSITGMPSFMVSSSAYIYTKHSSSCCNFVQKVMPYHSNLEKNYTGFLFHRELFLNLC